MCYPTVIEPLPFLYLLWIANSMTINEPQESPNRGIVPSSDHKQWSALLPCLGLGIAFCLIGLTMACNPTDVESMQSFRESFHKMLGEPSSPYNFAQAAVIFYTVPGVLMIGLSLRKPTISRSVSFFFGALLLSIVLVKALFGRLDTFTLFQILVGIVLVYIGYGASSLGVRWRTRAPC